MSLISARTGNIKKEAFNKLLTDIDRQINNLDIEFIQTETNNMDLALNSGLTIVENKNLGIVASNRPDILNKSRGLI